jgi:protein PhnA
MPLTKTLQERCQSNCELCSEQTDLNVYALPPVVEESADTAVMLCGKCLGLIEEPSKDVNHWRCLSQSMWSEYPVVQVLVWRVLRKLSEHDWAQDLLGQIYLDEETQKWAEAASVSNESEDDTPPTKDSVGNSLQDGDAVTLIKDLDVKGAGFTAKRGTLVKNITLTSNPEHIEGRVNGTKIVLLTCFLKKANS